MATKNSSFPIAHIPKSTCKRMADWEHLPNWHRPAKYCLFRHLYFGSDQQLHNYLQAIGRKENRNYELVAESIDIKRLYYHSVFVPFTRLLDMCANIKLIDHAGNAEYYRLIKSLLARNKLQHLQYLPMPAMSSMNEYIECSIQMKSKIKQLKLSDMTTLFSSTHVFATLYSQLDQFIELETLHLEKASDLDQLDSLFDSCSALKELELKLHKAPSLRQLGFDVAEQSEEEENAIDYTKLKPHLTIRTAKIQLRTIVPKYVEYILHKFPRLTSLDLAPLPPLLELTPTCDRLTVSNGVMLSFLFALRKMHHAHVPLKFEVNDALDVIAKFLVVTNFDGTIEASYQLLVNTKYRLDNPLISYSSEPLKRKIHLQYHKGRNQENQPLRGPTIMPHLTLVQLVGSYIKQLVVHGMNNTFVQGVVNACHLVDYTLIRCPFLKHMGFVQCDLSYYPLEILPTPHIFMESLRFDDCLLHCPSFIKFSLVMPRLKCLVMKDCQFTSYLTKRQPNGSTRRSITLSFPFTHFDLFRFRNIRQYRSLSKIYLKLTTDAKTAYTMYIRDQTESTSTISKAFFDEPKVESDSLHIDFTCKSMKKFKMN
ncbi:hypothetical protein MBANPS3_010443 [Mucor bainieri]